MKFLKKILVAVNYSNALVSCSSAMLALGFSKIIKLPIYHFYALFVFFTTLSVYNFQRIVRAKQLNNAYSNHLTWIRRHNNYLIILTLATALACIILFILSFDYFKNTLPLLALGGMMSIAYVIKIKGKNLRNLPFLKMHAIALVWVLAMGIIPLIMQNNYKQNDWLFALNHYLLIAAICIAFDIRDLQYDMPQIKTLPQIIGITYSVRAALGLIILFTINALLLHSALITNVPFYMCMLYIILLIAKSGQKQLESYYAQLDFSILLLGLSYALC
jgi:hypothetical protein